MNNVEEHCKTKNMYNVKEHCKTTCKKCKYGKNTELDCPLTLLVELNSILAKDNDTE